MRICMLTSYALTLTQRQDVGTKKYPAPLRNPKDDAKKKKRAAKK